MRDSGLGISPQDQMHLFSAFHRERGQTVVMITHNEQLAVAADRVLHMRDGRVEDDVTNGASLRKLEAEVAA